MLCARFAALGPPARADGVGGRRLTAYASEGVHRCVPGALDMAGLGAEALRRIPVDENFRMDLAALRAAIAQDRAEGAQPFMIVGTAGSVDVGAFDDLAALAKIAGGEKIWFHVDGAFGALAALSPGYDALVKGMGDADSIAFDFHKWAQVTYDAGCLLVRDAALHGATFAQTVPYLAAAPRGLAGGQPWPCDLGPDLSRGFRALKIWMTLSAYGTDALAGIVETSCALAKHLAARVNASPQLQLCAPTALNIVCFRATDHSDAQTRDLVADLQEEGLFAPSTTRIGGHSAIRVAIVNHRTTRADIDALLDEILRRI